MSALFDVKLTFTQGILQPVSHAAPCQTFKPLISLGGVDAKEAGWHVSTLLVWKSLEGWQVGLVLVIGQSLLTPSQPSY